jgi:biopolymer transport protein ExbD
MPRALRRRSVHPEASEGEGELNIVPYLDIMVNLTMFMLVSITSLAALGIVNVTAPHTSDAAADAPAPEAKPPLLLTVGIAKKGFIIAGAGAVLAAAEKVEGEVPPTLPLTDAGKYDYKALTAKAMEIKTSYPDETKVIITADQTIPYEILIKTMDALRESEGKKLFFDVTLAMM